MHVRKVRAGARYVYRPVLMDKISPPVGAKSGKLQEGDVVKVVNLPGCPRCNTALHAFVQNEAGEFLGLVMTNSLHPVESLP